MKAFAPQHCARRSIGSPTRDGNKQAQKKELPHVFDEGKKRNYPLPNLCVLMMRTLAAQSRRQAKQHSNEEAETSDGEPHVGLLPPLRLQWQALKCKTYIKLSSAAPPSFKLHTACDEKASAESAQGATIWP